MSFPIPLGLSFVFGFIGVALLKGDWPHVMLGILALVFAAWLFERGVIRRRFW